MPKNSLIEVPQWHIYDSTKIACYQECPRKYFYNYILGWISELPNVHLVHGRAWHKAMEYMTLNYPYTPKTINEAHGLYLLDYSIDFPNRETDVDRAPKIPPMALTGLAGYSAEFLDEDASAKPLYTEIGGSVMLDKDIFVHFKIDSILQDSRGYFSREHKTGSRLDDKWRMKWKMITQTGTYNHVLYCLYPENEVWGVEINGSIWHKGSKKSAGEVIFERVPARRKIDMMENWRVQTISWVQSMKQDTEKVLEVSENAIVLEAFRQNPGDCTSYFGCKYFDYCIAWANPLRSCQEVPIGFKQEHWDPTAVEVHQKFVL